MQEIIKMKFSLLKMAKLLFLSSCGLPSHVAGPHRVCRKWLVFLKLHFSSHKSRLPNSRSSRVSLQTQDLSQTEKRMFMWKTKKICFLDFTFCWPCIMQWFLVNDQLDAQIPFYVLIFFIYNSVHVSSTSCSSSGETNCINTTSGNCHSVLVAVSCATNTEW